MPDRLDELATAKRVAAEFQPGQTIALGPGLPARVAEVVPPGAPVQLLSDGGVLGYHRIGVGGSATLDANGKPAKLNPGASAIGLADWAGMLRGGHVDTAVIQPARVSANGDFTGWQTAATPDLFAPGPAVDLAAGSSRVIAMLRHTEPDGSPNIVSRLEGPVDGRGCIDLIVTDLGVIEVGPAGLELIEAAPGVTDDDVAALTGAPLRVPANMQPMGFQPTTGNPPAKVFSSGLSAVSDVPNGAVVMIDGFAGPGGTPHYLLTSLRDHGARELTIISNTAGIARVVNFGTPPGKQAIDHTILIDNRQVRKAVASYPVSPSASRPTAFEMAYRRGEVELELVPQGTLAERLRAGGAGVEAFYTPTGAGTLIADGKETRVIDGRSYVLERALRADFCIIRGHRADTLGNVVYKGTSRNFNSVMAPAARVTIVEVDEVVEPGVLGPEQIITPGIYINRIVVRPPDFSPYE